MAYSKRAAAPADFFPSALNFAHKWRRALLGSLARGLSQRSSRAEASDVFHAPASIPNPGPCPHQAAWAGAGVREAESGPVSLRRPPGSWHGRAP